MALILVDTGKLLQQGFAPKLIKKIKDLCSIKQKKQRSLITAERAEELLNTNVTALSKLTSAGVFPVRKGDRSTKVYYAEEILLCLWRVLHEEDLDNNIKRQKELKLKIENKAALGEYVKKDIAEDRVVSLLKALTRMYNYVVKSSAPLVAGCPTAKEAEKILHRQFKDIFDLIEDQQKRVEWKDEKTLKD